MPLSTEEEQTTLPGKDTENVTLLRHDLYVRMNNPQQHFGQSADHAPQLVYQSGSHFQTTPLIMYV